MKERLRAVLGSRNVALWVSLVALVLAIPTVTTGFILDDYTLRLAVDPKLTGVLPGVARAPWDAFRFQENGADAVRGMQSLGVEPWWTVPDFRLAFMRPLSSLLHAFDFRFFGDSPVPMHVESLLVFVAGVAIAALVYRRVIGATWVAGLAAFFYAVDDAHATPLVWLANRNALLATTFGFAALLGYVGARDPAASDRHRRNALLASVLCTLLALASGEASFAALAYLPAYALSLDEAPWRARLRSLAPHAFVLVAWLAAYRALGYGARGGDFYIDPFDRPGPFIVGALHHIPVLLLAQFALPPADLWALLPPNLVTRVSILAAVVVALGALLVGKVLAGDRRARFFTVGVLASLVPLAATLPNDRLLLAPGLGAFGLVALFLERARDTARPLRYPATALAGLFVFLHVLAAPLMPLRARAAAVSFQNVVDRAEASLPNARGGTLVVLNAPYCLVSVYALSMRAAKGEANALHSLRSLAIDIHGTLTVLRTDDRELVLTFEEGFPQDFFSHVYRSEAAPFAVGNEFRVDDMRVRILAVDAAGHATKIAYRFDTSLDDPRFVWTVWEGDRFVPYRPPPIGEREVRTPIDLMTAIEGKRAT